MKTEITDEKLKQLFRKIRLENEVNIPAFEQTVPKSVTVVSPFASVWRLATAMALIILFGIGTVMFIVPQSNSSVDLTYENWSTLSNWKAATDNMLTFAGSKIDSTLTTSTDVLLEGVSETSNE
jgi:hypothetical protein